MPSARQSCCCSRVTRQRRKLRWSRPCKPIRATRRHARRWPDCCWTPSSPQAAIDTLQAGLQLDPAQAGMAMILARVQVEKGELAPALETMRRSLPYAAERADYQAFLAALLQRDGRHPEAIEHYQQALRKAPDNGLWWMGQAISLREAGRSAEARDAFSRASAGSGLTPQLQAFVEQQLRQLTPAER